jgi:hypothetical protein
MKIVDTEFKSREIYPSYNTFSKAFHRDRHQMMCLTGGLGRF